jgi:hypothetical protein
MGHGGPRQIGDATEKGTRLERGDRGGLLRFDRARRFLTPVPRHNSKRTLKGARAQKDGRAADVAKLLHMLRLKLPLAYSRPSNNAPVRQRRTPSPGRVFAQPEMRSVVVIVGNVLGEESPQVLLVQRDYVVEQLAAAAADPTLRHSVLPRTSNGGPHSRDVHDTDGSAHFESILRIVVQYEELGNTSVGESFTQLLCDPSARRMPCDWTEPLN